MIKKSEWVCVVDALFVTRNRKIIYAIITINDGKLILKALETFSLILPELFNASKAVKNIASGIETVCSIIRIWIAVIKTINVIEIFLRNKDVILASVKK